MFPVRDKKVNAKWNKYFGYVYDDITRWDTHIRVAKKFYEFYRKIDIGIFLAGTFYYLKDTTNGQEETCWMTKPYKYMGVYEQWYEMAENHFKEEAKKENKPKSTKTL